MSARPRKSGGINLGAAFASMGSTVVESAGATMPAYAQHVADTVEIALNPRNRRKIDPESEDIQDLAKSLVANGQMQAIAVVPKVEFLAWEGFDRHRDDIGAGAKFVVIGGGRRRVAAGVAGLPRMDISIKAGLTREQFLRMTLIENLDRRDLKPLEEALQIQELREETGDSYAQIGEQLEGRTKGWVGQRLDLLKLSKPLQAELDSDAKGSMTLTQARGLLKRIREEVGESDDAWVSEERQWQLWEELRAGSAAVERLPRKRSTAPEPVSPPAVAATAPDAGGSEGGVPVPAFSSPERVIPSANPSAAAAPPAAFSSSAEAPAPRPRRAAGDVRQDESDSPAAKRPGLVNAGNAMVWADVDVADLAAEMRRRMPPEKWTAFVTEVQRLVAAG